MASIPTTKPPPTALTEPPLVISADAGYPESIELDGRISSNGNVQYIGRATRQSDGIYVCLARVGTALCRVEVRVTPLEGG